MKRWTLRILVCLILGAITTVAVAWGLALNDDLSIEWLGTRTSSDVRYALVRDARRWSDRRVEIVQRREISISSRFGSKRIVITWNGPEERERVSTPINLLPSWSRFAQTLPGSPANNGHVQRYEERAFGWPLIMLSMRREGIENDGTTVTAPNDVISLRAETLGVARLEEIVLPTRWHLLGAALGTLFWATVWFALLFVVGLRITGPMSIQQMIWRVRGRCPRCGYDLRGNLSAGCPECGWARKAECEVDG